MFGDLGAFAWPSLPPPGRHAPTPLGLSLSKARARALRWPGEELTCLLWTFDELRPSGFGGLKTPTLLSAIRICFCTNPLRPHPSPAQPELVEGRNAALASPGPQPRRCAGAFDKLRLSGARGIGLGVGVGVFRCRPDSPDTQPSSHPPHPVSLTLSKAVHRRWRLPIMGFTRSREGAKKLRLAEGLLSLASGVVGNEKVTSPQSGFLRVFAASREANSSSSLRRLAMLAPKARLAPPGMAFDKLRLSGLGRNAKGLNRLVEATPATPSPKPLSPRPPRSKKGATIARRALLGDCMSGDDQPSTCSASTVRPLAPTSAKPPVMRISSGWAPSVR